MEYKLSDCSHCGGNVIVIPCLIEDKYGRKVKAVSHGTCDSCLRDVVLPTEEFAGFVMQHCEEIYLY
jgi:hypothetical protein